MAIYYTTVDNVQETLDEANQEDIIYLPNESIDIELVISVPCSVKGQEGTIITQSLRIEEEVEISNVNINTTASVGLVLNNFSGSISNFEISGSATGILIENSSNFSITETKVFNCSTGVNIKNSKGGQFSMVEVFDCDFGYNIEGSSSIVGDIFESQNFGLNVESTDLSGLSRIEEEITIDGSLGISILNQINNQLGDLSPFIEAYIDNNVMCLRLLPSVQDDATIVVEENSVFGWASVQQKEPIIGTIEINNVSTINTTINISIDRKKEYSIIVNEEEYLFTCKNNSTYASLVSNLNNASSNGNKLKNIVYTSFSNNDIRMTALSANDITTERFALHLSGNIDSIVDSINQKQSFVLASNDNDRLKLVGSFTISGASSIGLDGVVTNEAVSTEIIGDIDVDIVISDIQRENSLIQNLNVSLIEKNAMLEANRDDRTHHMDFVACQMYENKIGIRIANSNHLNFDNNLVYSNTDIGILHNAVSYSNQFTGEIYDNKNYGVKNTDKDGTLIARQVWWGDITGPSMMGTGSGDKVSSYVTFDNWRQNGNEPEQLYPYTRDWIWRMLGYPLVRVELTEEQVTDAIGMAIDRFEEYRTPEQTYHYLSVFAGQPIIELPVWMSKKDVMDVVYSPHSDLFSQLTGAGESFYLTYYLQNTGGTFLSDFYIAMSYKETLEQTLGIAPTYELFTSKNAQGEWRDYIRLAPKPSVSLRIGILYNRPMTEEEVDSSTWIRKYALTWAKEMLGRVRSKFASVPGPTGEMQMDGQALIQEAQQERQALDESVISRGPPLTFTMG